MPLVLAVPSKGRLQENAAAFFARAGLKLAQNTGARDYRGKLVGVPGVEVRYLSASEIAAQLASGAAHLGITGEDLIREIAARRPRPGRTPDAARLRPGHRGRRRAPGLDRRPRHERPRRGRRRDAGPPRQAPAHRHEVHQPHPPLLRRARRGRLPHRREPGRHRGRAGGGLGRDHRRHHHHGRDAGGQRPEDPGRRDHPALGGEPRRLPERALGRAPAPGPARRPRPHPGGGARPHHPRGPRRHAGRRRHRPGRHRRPARRRPALRRARGRAARWCCTARSTRCSTSPTPW